MFEMINAMSQTAVGAAAILVGVPAAMAGVVAKGAEKLDNYQERERAARRMKVNMIRRQYGQPALR